MKTTITKLKNTLEGFHSRVGKAEEWICELEDKTRELIRLGQQREKRILKSEDPLRDPQELILTKPVLQEMLKGLL